MKRTVLTTMLLAAMVIVVACGGDAHSGGDTAPGSAAPPPASASAVAPSATPSAAAPSASAAFEPVTVTDDSGETLTFDKPVETVACVVSLCVDVLAELGMEPAAIGESGVRVIATAPEFYGSKGESFPSIGGSFFEPGIEDLVTVAPDLVIGLKGAHEALREGLKGVTQLFLSSPQHYNDSIAFLETMGRLTGRTEEAAASRQRFLDKLATAKEKAPLDKKPLILFGSDVNFSIVTDIGLGGTVMKEISNYPWKIENPEDDPYGEGSVPYSLEKLLTENPDVLFIESYSYSPGTLPVSEQLAASPIWSELKAVQNKQVYEVRSPIWGDGRGTRSLGIMMDEALAILYPDLF